ncbi:MAG: hypothetical protein ACODAD_03100, partial [Planctomycetota bacterium]
PMLSADLPWQGMERPARLRPVREHYPIPIVLIPMFLLLCAGNLEPEGVDSLYPCRHPPQRFLRGTNPGFRVARQGEMGLQDFQLTGYEADSGVRWAFIPVPVRRRASRTTT